MTAVVYVAAKAPRLRFAKTRLGEAIGHQRAVALYRAFLRDIAARFQKERFALGWYLTPADAWPDIQALVGSAGSQRVIVQGEGDWTERQRQLFRGAARRGEQRLILIGSDSPHVSVELVEQALAELDRHEVVFGPTYDGGYYLIGMRGWHDVLRGVRMSTDTVLEDLIARAGEDGLSVAQVETTFDVDEVDDLRHLRELAATRDDLRATRAVLETIDSMSLVAQAASPAGTGQRPVPPASGSVVEGTRDS
jgi:rSAM/selenodomain-associated transferase 1